MASKGKRIRPCHVCDMPVNFVLWESETRKRRKPIYHWANPDGSHHEHARLTHRDEKDRQLAHLKDIMSEDVPW